MKKWLCGLLVLVMLVLTCSVGFGETETVTEEEVEAEAEAVMDEVETEEAAEGISDEDDSEIIEFSPDMMDGMEWTMSEWYESSLSRAMLTVLCTLDLISELGDDFDFANALFYESSYVIKYDSSLIIYLESDEYDIIVFYPPAVGTAYYSITSNMGSDTLTEMVFDGMSYEYKKNDLDAIAEVVNMISEVMEE